MSEKTTKLSEALVNISQLLQEASETYRKDAQAFWDSLSHDDRLKAFYVVTSKIYEGDVTLRRSYRGVLYEVFGFDYSAYSVGMDSNYMELHNLIQETLDERKPL